MDLRVKILFVLVVVLNSSLFAQFKKDSTENIKEENQVILLDTVVEVKDVEILVFKNKEEEMLYFKYKSRIRKVIPYVKIAKQLYAELQDKEDNSKKKEYKKYRKGVEKEMRDKFEKELKDLSIGQGQMLVKLINRETDNNCYGIIKDVKGGFSAWTWQIVAKRWGYDLKEPYDKKKERLVELAIRSLGNEYKID